MGSDLLAPPMATTAQPTGAPPPPEVHRVKVFLRVRPPHSGEIDPSRGVTNIVSVGAAASAVVPTSVVVSGKQYTFDQVFGATSTNREVYHGCLRSMVDKVLSGFSATFMCYGHTGTGKTHTMSYRPSASSADGGASQQGVVFQCVRALFDELVQRVKQGTSTTWEVRMSYVQLYRDNVQDLQSPNTPFLKIRSQQPNKEAAVPTAASSSWWDTTPIPDVTVSPGVNSLLHFMSLYDAADKNRVVAETQMNKQSSRGHSVLTLYVQRTEAATFASPVKDASSSSSSPLKGAGGGAGAQHTMFHRGKLVFVDLAGYERMTKTMVEGIHKDEAKHINLSLSALASVIRGLVCSAGGTAVGGTGGTTHIPFRNSKLTMLLEPSLKGNSLTSIMLTLGPSSADVTETLNTLHFGHNALQCKTSVYVTQSTNLDYRKEYEKLLQSYQELQRQKEEDEGVQRQLISANVAPMASTSPLRSFNSKDGSDGKTLGADGIAGGSEGPSAASAERIQQLENIVRSQASQIMDTHALIDEAIEESTSMQSELVDLRRLAVTLRTVVDDDGFAALIRTTASNGGAGGGPIHPRVRRSLQELMADLRRYESVYAPQQATARSTDVAGGPSASSGAMPVADDDEVAQLSAQSLGLQGGAVAGRDGPVVAPVAAAGLFVPLSVSARVPPPPSPPPPPPPDGSPPSHRHRPRRSRSSDSPGERSDHRQESSSSSPSSATTSPSSSPTSSSSSSKSSGSSSPPTGSPSSAKSRDERPPPPPPPPRDSVEGNFKWLPASDGFVNMVCPENGSTLNSRDVAAASEARRLLAFVNPQNFGRWMNAIRTVVALRGGGPLAGYAGQPSSISRPQQQTTKTAASTFDRDDDDDEEDRWSLQRFSDEGRMMMSSHSSSSDKRYGSTARCSVADLASFLDVCAFYTVLGRYSSDANQKTCVGADSRLPWSTTLSEDALAVIANVAKPYYGTTDEAVDLSGCHLPDTLGITTSLFSSSEGDKSFAIVMPTVATMVQTLSPSRSDFPRACHLRILGSAVEGMVLEAVYQYRGRRASAAPRRHTRSTKTTTRQEGKVGAREVRGRQEGEGATVVRWYQLVTDAVRLEERLLLVTESIVDDDDDGDEQHSTRGGGGSLLSARHYLCTTQDVASTIICQVIPARDDGVRGTPILARSPTVVLPMVPVIHNLRIAGEALLGDTLTASYDFLGGEEGGSVLRWYRAQDGLRFVPVSVTTAPDRKRLVGVELLHQYVRVQVTPVRRSDASKGNSVISKLIYVNLSDESDAAIMRMVSCGVVAWHATVVHRITSSSSASSSCVDRRVVLVMDVAYGIRVLLAAKPTAPATFETLLDVPWSSLMPMCTVGTASGGASSSSSASPQLSDARRLLLILLGDATGAIHERLLLRLDDDGDGHDHGEEAKGRTEQSGDGKRHRDAVTAFFDEDQLDVAESRPTGGLTIPQVPGDAMSAALSSRDFAVLFFRAVFCLSQTETIAAHVLSPGALAQFRSLRSAVGAMSFPSSSSIATSATLKAAGVQTARFLSSLVEHTPATHRRLGGAHFVRAGGVAADGSGKGSSGETMQAGFPTITEPAVARLQIALHDCRNARRNDLGPSGPASRPGSTTTLLAMLEEALIVEQNKLLKLSQQQQQPQAATTTTSMTAPPFIPRLPYLLPNSPGLLF